jgi:hypothetical protein
VKYSGQTYKWSKPFSYVRHEWSVLGPKAAVHFHISIVPPYEASAGLEIHYFEPPTYMQDRAPSHVDCRYTGGRCWHDGTSLYATETLWPMIEPLLKSGDHESVFRILESELTERCELREEVTA